MKNFNLYYIFSFLLGCFLLYNLFNQRQIVVAFYGLAETNETEINFNYAVVIDSILIAPGEAVKAGQTLISVTRKNPKETLQDEFLTIDELNSEKKIWENKQKEAIKILEQQKHVETIEFDNKIEHLKDQVKQHKSLLEGIKSIDIPEVKSPLLKQIAAIESEKDAALNKIDKEIRGLKSQFKTGDNPYKEKIKKLKAHYTFDTMTQVQKYKIEAPTDGLIGNLYCKVKEHVPSFSTLLSFYEPNPNLIKGYLNENLIMDVSLGDSILIKSLIVPNKSLVGTVEGLGSRIIEIPERLRKYPAIKTYGREVAVKIPSDNAFLQKEKVGLELLGAKQKKNHPWFR